MHAGPDRDIPVQNQIKLHIKKQGKVIIGITYEKEEEIHKRVSSSFKDALFTRRISIICGMWNWC